MGKVYTLAHGVSVVGSGSVPPAAAGRPHIPGRRRGGRERGRKGRGNNQQHGITLVVTETKLSSRFSMTGLLRLLLSPKPIPLPYRYSIRKQCISKTTKALLELQQNILNNQLEPPQSKTNVQPTRVGSLESRYTKTCPAAMLTVFLWMSAITECGKKLISEKMPRLGNNSTRNQQTHLKKPTNLDHQA